MKSFIWQGTEGFKNSKRGSSVAAQQAGVAAAKVQCLGTCKCTLFCDLQNFCFLFLIQCFIFI